MMKTSTVEQVTKVEKEELALQVLSHVVEQGQMWAGYLEDNGLFLKQGIDEEDIANENFIPLWVETDEVRSEYFATLVSNAGMQHRLAYPQKKYVGIAKRVDTSGGVDYEYVDKLVHDARGMEVTLKVAGCTSQVVVSLPEEVVSERGEKGFFRLSPEEFPLLTFWEPGGATSSQTRKAELVCKRGTVSYAEYLSRLGFDINAFLVDDKVPGRKKIKSIDKMWKRIKQTSSSSRPRYLMKGYRFVKEEQVPFVLWKGSDREEVSPQTKVTWENAAGEEVSAYILDDFLVKQKVQIAVPRFHNDGRVDRVMTHTVIDKAATDGSHMMDRETALRVGMADENGELRAGEQFRFGQAIKGFVFLYPGLKTSLGVDFVFFKGGIKGDALRGIRKGTMPFAVLNRARKDEVKPSINLSRQVLSAIQNKAMVQALGIDTKDLITRALGFEPKAISQLLSLKEEPFEEGVQEVDIDQLTTKLYAVGRSTFLQSYTMQKKLYDLLQSVIRKYETGGSMFLKDAAFKHMLVDPWGVVQYLKKGELTAVKGESVQHGILPERAVVSVLEEKDGKVTQRLDSSPCCLFRFPFLHQFEGRKVNVCGGPVFGSEQGRLWYEAQAKRGYLEGILFYSMWDMNPEAQSGADFDGDQSVWTTNLAIIHNMKQQPLFLDYSLVQQEDGSFKLVAGCPFPGETQDLHRFLSEKEIAFMEKEDVQLAGDSISAPAAVTETEDWVNLVGHLGAALARDSLVLNDIGNFTNINSTVFQMMSMLERKMEAIQEVEPNEELVAAYLSLKKERDGYERLSFFMACAIRWEIDKAKHGGAYRDRLPFLEALDGKMKPSEVFELEETYNVSLQRLLFGHVSFA